MKKLACFVLCFATFAVAKDRSWQDAKLVKITSTSNQGAAAFPMGTAVIAMPVNIVTTYYCFQTPDGMKYVMASRKKRPLNLTLNGIAKIDIEGQNGYVLDDSGKQLHLPIVGKAVPKED